MHNDHCSESPPIGDLISSKDSIPPDTRINLVADRFFAERELDSLALVEDGRVLGLATRNKIFSILFRKFGFELYGKLPILEIADHNPLLIGSDESLDRALARAMERDFQDIYDDIVIVDENELFLGLLSVKRMVVAQGNALAHNIIQRELAISKAREMKRVSDLKSHFIAHVSHELRSPVHAIIGFAELMRMSLESGLHEQLPKRLSHLSASAVNLRSIVTNILDLSKIEAGKMEVSTIPCDLGELLYDVAETTRVLLAGKPVDVEVMADNIPPVIATDPIKVRQIVLNLAGNAAKFTEKGRIVISVEDQADGILICVADTGIGIRNEDLEKLFMAFSQLEDAMTRKHEGTGLGLAITRQLTSLLGGSINVQSTYGQGTKFSVFLPAGKSHKGTDHDKEEKQSACGG